MSKESKIWQFAARRLERNEAVMLLVVAESAGSSPGRQGFKMIVAGDELRGSVGGGVMEVALVDRARILLNKETGGQGDKETGRQGDKEPWRQGDKEIRRQGDKETSRKSKIQNPKSKIKLVHRKDSPNASGMICSGEQTVIFFELNREHLETVKMIGSALKDHRRMKIAISNSTLSIAESTTDDPVFSFETTGEKEFLYEEMIGYQNKISIVGGGHCALALSELMAKLDFHISLFDDRSRLNTLEKNKFADVKTVVDSYESIGDLIESGENTYVVVMTLGYKFDEIVVRRLFAKNFRYLGVLGSRAKIKTLLRNLEDDGFDRKRLGQIRTPVGLPINSRTPEEIAVSIAAEIIAVKNERPGKKGQLSYFGQIK